MSDGTRIDKTSRLQQPRRSGDTNSIKYNLPNNLQNNLSSVGHNSPRVDYSAVPLGKVVGETSVEQSQENLTDKLLWNAVSQALSKQGETRTPAGLVSNHDNTEFQIAIAQNLKKEDKFIPRGLSTK